MWAEFFFDALLFVALVVAVVVGLVLWRIPIKQLPTWAQTKDGKGVIKGVVLAPLVIVVFAVIMFLLCPAQRARNSRCRVCRAHG